MRLKLGRPDLSQYAARFDVPRADADLSVTFLGVATLLLDDGSSAILTDGFFSRPSLLDVSLRKLTPNEKRIDDCMHRASIKQLDAVLPVHTHFDHAMDSAVVAAKTDAMLVGGSSTAMVGHALPDRKVRVATSGETLTFGSFEITLIASEHCPPDRWPGRIEFPVVPPVRASAYRCGEAWSLLLRHSSGKSALVQGSAGCVAGSLAGQQADVAYLGVGQLGIQSDEYIRTYWQETVRTVGARRAVLIHWDDFFRPLTEPLRALPYAGDDLDNTMRVLTPLAEADGVQVSFPTVWQRENPWAPIVEG